jgi:hypothetical protein
VNLGTGINTAATDAGPSFFEHYDRWPTRTVIPRLYMASNRPGGPGGLDIYIGSVPGGWAGAPTLVTELNSPQNDLTPAVRRDGLEILIASARPGGLGGFDLWRAWRRSVRAPWSTPTNLGPLSQHRVQRRLPVALVRRRDARLPIQSAGRAGRQ